MIQLYAGLDPPPKVFPKFPAEWPQPPPCSCAVGIVRWLDTPYNLSPQSHLMAFAMEQKKEELRRRDRVRPPGRPTSRPPETGVPHRTAADGPTLPEEHPPESQCTIFFKFWRNYRH